MCSFIIFSRGDFKLPKVSIIVPTYNHQEFIAECLDSIISQTYEDWEAIIIDDGSTDDTSLIIKSYIEWEPRIKYFFQENKGILKLSQNINHGLELSSGEYIGILEGDDIWPSDKLEKQIPIFDNSNVGVVWGNGYKKHEDSMEFMEGVCSNVPQTAIQNNPLGEALKYLVFSSDFFKMPTCAVMYKKSVLMSIGGFYQPKGMVWCDRSTWAVLSCVCEFAYIPEALGFWRWHPAQQTQNKDSDLTTFDYIFQDNSVPQVLAEKIEKYREPFKVFSKIVLLRKNFTFRRFFSLLKSLLIDIPSVISLCHIILKQRKS